LNQNTRQRIVGTVVLAVAAAILLPVIFDGDGSYQPPLDTSMPPVAQRPEASRSAAQRPVITADTDAIRIRPENLPDEVISAADQAEDPADTAATAPGQTPPPSASTPNNNTTMIETSPPAQTPRAAPAATRLPPAEVTAALDVTGLPEAWSVRVGAFSSQSNATALVARLQSDGLRAYTRPVESAQGRLTAVFVGPLVDRTAAQNLLERLRLEYQLAGLVVRYQIEEQ
jgi:DedD protein